METFIYKVLSNDWLYLISNLCEINNYADDNSVCVHAKNVNDTVSKFESISKLMFNWFNKNNRQANSDKSQFILFTNDVLCNAWRKTGRQLNALGRLANVLSVDDKNILFECFILSHFNFFLL